MEVKYKATWTRPSNRENAHIVGKIAPFVFAGIIMVSLVSAYTEGVAIYHMTNSLPLTIMWCVLIEAIFNGVVYLSGISFFFALEGKRSYIPAALFFAGLAVAILLVSRSFSADGKDIIIDDKYTPPTLSVIDSTEFSSSRDAALARYSGAVAGIDADFLKSKQEIVSKYNREKRRKGGMKYGLANVDALISSYKADCAGGCAEWKKNALNILPSAKKELQAQMQAEIKVLKAQSDARKMQAASERDNMLGQATSKLSAAASSVGIENREMMSAHHARISEKKQWFGYAIWVLLFFSMCARYLVFLFRFLAGQRLEFQEVHHGKISYLVSVYFQGMKARLYNRIAGEVENRIGDTIEVKKYSVRTAEKQNAVEQEQEKQHKEGEKHKQTHKTEANVVSLSVEGRPQISVSQSVIDSVSYRSLVKSMVEKHKNIPADRIRKTALAVQQLDESGLKNNIRNFHKRDGEMNRIKFVFAKYLLTQAGYEVKVGDEKALTIQKTKIV